MTDPTEPASAAPRRPTGRDDRFLIPLEHVPPTLAERVRGGGDPPVAPRPAATVVLLREAEAGAEALLLRRPRRSSFAADAWVFPGGVVDAADARLEPGVALRGPAPEAWARRLGLPDPADALAFVVAALREAWEETGLLLAEGAGSADELAEARRSLLAGAAGFGELAARHGLRLRVDDLLYVAHWITPEPEPRRYDTRFFAARVPAGAVCRLEGEELVESRWVRPADAVAEFERGSIRLLPPTVHTLRRLAEHPSLDALWAALRDAPVPTHRPRMRLEPAGVVIEL